MFLNSHLDFLYSPQLYIYYYLHTGESFLESADMKYGETADKQLYKAGLIMNINIEEKQREERLRLITECNKF